jgi:hypothetical protein
LNISLCVFSCLPERSRYFKVDDRVIARDYKGKDHKWIGGQIESSDGPLMYKVKTDLGSTWRRLQDYDKLHYTKINASEVCPQNVIIRGLLCLNTVKSLSNIVYISVMSLLVLKQLKTQ